MKCIDCENHCCIGDYATFLTLHDAKRISKETGIPINEFCFYAPICADKEGQEELMQSRDHTYFDFSNSGKVLQLKAKSDASCFFLKEKKCTIYTTRPLICRIFPLWYKKMCNSSNDIKVIIDDDGGDCWIIKNPNIPDICKNLGYTVDKMSSLIKQLAQEIEQYKQYEPDLENSTPSETAKKHNI